MLTQKNKGASLPKICKVPLPDPSPQPSSYVDHLEILQCLVPMETDGIGGYQLVATWKVPRLRQRGHQSMILSRTPWKVLNVQVSACPFSEINCINCYYNIFFQIYCWRCSRILFLHMEASTCSWNFFLVACLDVSRVILLKTLTPGCQECLALTKKSIKLAWLTNRFPGNHTANDTPARQPPKKKTNPQNLRILTPILEVQEPL